MLYASQRNYDFGPEKRNNVSNLSKFITHRILNEFELIKSVLENTGAKRFFEIGTGRGTACYAASLVPSVEEIVTVDIVPHEEKHQYGMGYKDNYVSNKDLYDMIPFEEKKKIDFRLRDDTYMQYEDYFDVCFTYLFCPIYRWVMTHI